MRHQSIQNHHLHHQPIDLTSIINLTDSQLCSALETTSSSKKNEQAQLSASIQIMNKKTPTIEFKPNFSYPLKEIK